MFYYKEKVDFGHFQSSKLKLSQKNKNITQTNIIPYLYKKTDPPIPFCGSLNPLDKAHKMSVLDQVDTFL